MLRQAVAARRSIAGLATQRISNRLPSATIDLVAQRSLGRPLAASLRQASFFPWRNQYAKPALPVYFPKPRRLPTRQQVRRKLGYLVLAGVIYYMCFQIFLSVVIDTLLDWADELDTPQLEASAEEDEEEPFFFLPFPFGIQTVEQPPYKGSDPEWQTFVKVNKDEKLQKEIRLDLANLIRRSAEKNPALVNILGAKDTKIKKYWLDIIYPRSPPPKHYLSGLIIDDEGIFWGDRPVDSLAANQINAAIYPKAVVLTAWTFFNSLLTQAVQDFAGALGLKSAETPEVTWQSMAMDRLKEQRGLGSGNDQVVKVSGQPDKPPTLSVHTGNNPTIAGIFPGDIQGNARIQAAIRAAAVTFRKNWRPSPAPPARGCIRVDGVVELQGKRAVLAVFVVGWYDPNKKKFVAVDSKVKHLLPLKQRPAAD